MAFFKTTDKVNINFHEYGSKENPAIIFLTGYSASEVTWFAQINPFVAAGFRVITYDYRSHGQSEQVLFGLTLARLAKDLQELLDYLELKQAIVIGHSMGAAVIMAYEELFTDERLLAVITEDQSPTFLKSPTWLGGETGKRLAELEDFINDFPRTKLTEKNLPDDVKRELGKGMFPFNFKAYRGLLQNVIMQDWRANLTQESKPHLFLAGGSSPVFPPEHAQAARNLQKNPDSEVYIFEGSGHIPHIEDIEKFNQIVLEFIEKISNK